MLQKTQPVEQYPLPAVVFCFCNLTEVLANLVSFRNFLILVSCSFSVFYEPHSWMGVGAGGAGSSEKKIAT